MARNSGSERERTFRVVMTGAHGDTRLDGRLVAELSRLLRVPEPDARDLVDSMPCDVAVSASGAAARRLQLGLEKLGLESHLEPESPLPPSRPSLGASLRGGEPPPWEGQAPAGPRFSAGVISHGDRPTRPRNVGAERRAPMDSAMFVKLAIVVALAAGVMWLRDPRVSVETPFGSQTFPYRTRALAPGADSGVPIIVGLHGNGDTTEGFDEGLFEGFEGNARIALLQAPVSYSAGRWGGKAWPHLPGELRPAAEAVNAAAAELAEIYDAPCKPIVIGFSGGAGVAYYQAANHPQAFSSIMPISGWLPEQLIPTNIEGTGLMPVVRALHGEGDVVIRHGQAKETVDALNRAGLSVTLESFPGNHLAAFRDKRERVHALLLEAIARCPLYPR